MTNVPEMTTTAPASFLPQVASVQRSPFALRIKLKMRLWQFVQATVFRWSPGPMRGFRRWLLRLFGARLSSTASIHPRARIDCPWNLVMGDCASLGEDSWVYSLDRIVLHDYACIGQRSMLLTGTHDFSDPTFPLVTRPIEVGYGVWIAAGVTVLPGITLGRLAVIGAGSVVTKDMPEATVCAGNPCRAIKPRVLAASLSSAA